MLIGWKPELWILPIRKGRDAHAIVIDQLESPMLVQHDIAMLQIAVGICPARSSRTNVTQRSAISASGWRLCLRHRSFTNVYRVPQLTHSILSNGYHFPLSDLIPRSSYWNSTSDAKRARRRCSLIAWYLSLTLEEGEK